MTLSVVSRTDNCFAVYNSAQFVSNPGKAHWCAVKHLLRFPRAASLYFVCITALKNTNFLVFRIPIGPPTQMIASQLQVFASN